MFTSHKMLAMAAQALGPWLASRNIALFAQSEGMPRSKMVEMFKSDVDSVIFGADTFWQGVDVPGDALSNVIITRLPFAVPSHPLLEARLEFIRKPRRQPVYRVSASRGRHQAQAGIRAADPHQDRPWDRGDPGSAGADQALWAHVSGLIAELPADCGNTGFRRHNALSDRRMGQIAASERENRQSRNRTDGGRLYHLGVSAGERIRTGRHERVARS